MFKSLMATSYFAPSAISSMQNMDASSLRIRIRISVHENLDPDPHQSKSKKQGPGHFDEEQDCRIRNCFKVKSRIWIRICIKVKSQIRIRLKVKRGIWICIIVMRIRNTGCSQRRCEGTVHPYWLLSEKPHSHWLNCRAGTS